MKTIQKTTQPSWTDNAAEWVSDQVGTDTAQTKAELALMSRTGIIPHEAEKDPAAVALFILRASRLGLDPLNKEAYMLPFWTKEKDRSGAERWVCKFALTTSIDGMRKQADKSGTYAGADEPTFDDGMNLDQCAEKGLENPRTARVTVYRIVAGMRCAFTAAVRWKGFAQTDKSGNFTGKWSPKYGMPFHMLAKCAEAQALRKAFPAALAGVYAYEEFDTMREPGPTVAGAVLSPTQEDVPCPKSEEIEAKIKGIDSETDLKDYWNALPEACRDDTAQEFFNMQWDFITQSEGNA